MKKILILVSLILLTGMQTIQVKAVEPVVDLSKAQVAHLDTAPKGVSDDLKDEVTALNEKHGDLKEYDESKQYVYNKLSDYMKIKYKLYNIYAVEDIHDLTIAKNEEKRTRGLILYYYNSIILENYYEDNKSVMSYILFHELGHALDAYDETDNYVVRQGGKYTNTDEFKKIFDEEKYELQDASHEYYFTDKVAEYFAESYAIYMIHPDKMKKEAPKTYAFMDKVANQEYIDKPSTDWIVNNMKNSYLNPILAEIKSEKGNKQ